MELLDIVDENNELTEVKYFELQEVKNRIINKDREFAFSNENYINEIISIVEDKIKN